MTADNDVYPQECVLWECERDGCYYDSKCDEPCGGETCEVEFQRIVLEARR